MVMMATVYCAVEMPVELAFFPNFYIWSFKSRAVCVDMSNGSRLQRGSVCRARTIRVVARGVNATHAGFSSTSAWTSSSRWIFG